MFVTCSVQMTRPKPSVEMQRRRHLIQVCHRDAGCACDVAIELIIFARKQPHGGGLASSVLALCQSAADTLALMHHNTLESDTHADRHHRLSMMPAYEDGNLCAKIHSCGERQYCILPWLFHS